MDLSGLSDEIIGLIEDSLIRKVDDIDDAEEKIEVMVELKEPLLENYPESTTPEEHKVYIESKIEDELPDELEIIRIYDFLNTIVLRIPAMMIKDLFSYFNIKNISDSKGDIRPMNPDNISDNKAEGEK